MIRDAVTCDRPDCMVFMLEPITDSDSGPEFPELIAAAGWIHDETGHTCPACAPGRYGDGPVLELGACSHCGGRTVDLPEGPSCMYCHHSWPHDLVVLHEEITEDDAAGEAGAARLEIGTVTLWQDPNGSGWGATCGECDKWADFADPLGFQWLCAQARLHTASHGKED